jgi:hypothetical protein
MVLPFIDSVSLGNYSSCGDWSEQEALALLRELVNN